MASRSLSLSFPLLLWESSYITLDVAEDKQGTRLVRVVYNGKELVLPGAAGPWISVSDLRGRLQDVMPRAEDLASRDAAGEESSAGASEISAAVSGGAKSTGGA